MKTLVFSPKAEADIDEIYDYTEEYWGFEKPKPILSSSGMRAECLRKGFDPAASCRI